jgi:hypothetical protein
MALLQLAESPFNSLAENDGMYLSEGPVADNYLFIPAGMFGMDSDTYVRSDFFDSLSDAEFEAVMTSLAPYQAQGLSAVGAIIGSAVAIGKKAAPALQKAIANRKAKVEAGTVKPIFKPGGALSNLAGKVKAGIQKLKDVPASKAEEVIEKTTPVSGQFQYGNAELNFNAGEPQQENFFTKYKTPLLIGGAALAGLVLFRTFKK